MQRVQVRSPVRELRPHMLCGVAKRLKKKMCVYIYIYMYIYTHTHTHRERERDTTQFWYIVLLY